MKIHRSGVGKYIPKVSRLELLTNICKTLNKRLFILTFFCNQSCLCFFTLLNIYFLFSNDDESVLQPAKKKAKGSSGFGDFSSW